MFKLDEGIPESWLRQDESEDESYQKDYEDAETYRDEYTRIIIKTRYENIFQRDQIREGSSITPHSIAKNFRLPNLELKKLDGGAVLCK